MADDAFGTLRLVANFAQFAHEVKPNPGVHFEPVVSARWVDIVACYDLGDGHEPILCIFAHQKAATFLRIGGLRGPGHLIEIGGCDQNHGRGSTVPWIRPTSMSMIIIRLQEPAGSMLRMRRLPSAEI